MDVEGTDDPSMGNEAAEVANCIPAAFEDGTVSGRARWLVLDE